MPGGNPNFVKGAPAPYGNQWKKGQSGNPAGRKPNPDAIAPIARMHGPAAIQRLAELAGLVKGGRMAESEPAQVAAMRELLDRGYGRPTQLIVGDGERPVAIHFEWAPAVVSAVVATDSQIGHDSGIEVEWTTDGAEPQPRPGDADG